MSLTPGLHNNVSFPDYQAIPPLDWINASLLKQIGDCPRAFQWSLANPREPTPSMVLGSLVHLAVFEPDDFADNIIPATDMAYRKAERIASRVRQHPRMERWLREGQSEIVALWKTDGESYTDVGCKARLDLLCPDRIVDLKTCANANPSHLIKHKYGPLEYGPFYDYGYHVQAAHYLDAMSRLYKRRDVPFTIFAVETTEPHLTSVLEFLPGCQFLERGIQERDSLLSRFVRCRSLRDWPSYSDVVYTPLNESEEYPQC